MTLNCGDVYKRQAMGRDPLAIDTAFRVSFCADNTPEDVDAFLNRFEDGMKHLQKIRKMCIRDRCYTINRTARIPGRK